MRQRRPLIKQFKSAIFVKNFRALESVEANLTGNRELKVAWQMLEAWCDRLGRRRCHSAA
jgi:hypothetical protein